MSDTREPQYQTCLDMKARKGLASLGLMTSFMWNTDPKRLGIVLARYKFAAKMLAGKNRVLEIGCGDAFGSRVVKQEVGALVVSDFDPLLLRHVDKAADADWPVLVVGYDVLSGPVFPPSHPLFNGAFALDVFEHIAPAKEDIFLRNVCASLDPGGAFVLGTPSLESQRYASPNSVTGHVNCKSGDDLKALLLRYFDNVFMFGMNDETVHTGFLPMCHYLLAVCAGVK